MKRFHIGGRGNAATPSTPPAFDPATFPNQARHLASNDAHAVRLLASAAFLVLDSILLVAAIRGDWFDRRGIAGDILTLLAVQVLLVLLAWAVTYAVALRRDTRQVRHATWLRETETGRDIDGDGIIGPPTPVGHVVRINGSGSQPQEFTLPDLEPDRVRRPLIGFPSDPPVTANDVIWVLSEAEAAGLTFRPWDKRRLPSGALIDRFLWGGILDGLVAWEFARSRNTVDNRRIVTLRTDVDIETMINAVRSAVAAASKP